jgi:hypothetical protein
MEIRRLIVCCDGTWDKRDQEHDGVPVPTNVFRIYNAIADNGDDGIRQLKFYRPGVGVERNIIKRELGGMVGLGLDSIIRRAYKWLCETYLTTGDKIYIFGFSRGAFLARSLSSMIGYCGLLVPDPNMDLWDQVKKAYDAGYRKKQPKNLWCAGNTRDDVKVHFLGVWDTVGALGIPDDRIILKLFDNPKRYRFHNTQLGDHVNCARQALSLDDDRSSFAPTLWTDAKGNIVESGRVKQLWFPGEHGDVGGGRREKGLSDGALLWMITEAEKYDLSFKKDMIKQIHPDFQDVAHRACVGIFKYLRTQPRNIPLIDEANVNIRIHESAFLRHMNPPIAQSPYRPTTLLKPGKSSKPIFIFAREKWNSTGLYLERDATYDFKAEGEWMDGWIKCDPAGVKKSNQSLAAKFFCFRTDVLARFNSLVVKRVLRNRNADFWGFTKRIDEYPLFSLVGVIANCGNPGIDGTPIPHQHFSIQTGCTFKIDKPGYLYCFANDGWEKYGNNKGSVKLTVTRK